VQHPLRIDTADPRPIWRQIEEGVLHLVASGALPAAAPVPSVRDLARELQVNPATVSKAYQRLTDAGVLAVRRGDGTYVADAPPALPANQRRERLREGARRYAGLAATLGASAEEVAEELAFAWRSLHRSRKPNDMDAPVAEPQTAERTAAESPGSARPAGEISEIDRLPPEPHASELPAFDQLTDPPHGSEHSAIDRQPSDRPASTGARTRPSRTPA
jgi:GntR family transcriptional regulator